jgi:hypothetical protein
LSRFQTTYGPKYAPTKIKIFIYLFSSLATASAREDREARFRWRGFALSNTGPDERLWNKYALKGGNYRQAWEEEFAECFEWVAGFVGGESVDSERPPDWRSG